MQKGDFTIYFVESPFLLHLSEKEESDQSVATDSHLIENKLRDEKDLLESYRKSGDLRLLGELYEPYMPLLYGVCFRYYKDHSRSEDAVMQIFESLIPKLRQHRVANFKSWLYTVARNHCLMDLRRDRKVTMVDLDADIESEEDGGDALMEQDLTRMEECLAELSVEQRTCVTLFYLDQKCYQLIADETGYTLNKVKSAIQNGKRNLKICMERKGHG